MTVLATIICFCQKGVIVAAINIHLIVTGHLMSRHPSVKLSVIGKSDLIGSLDSQIADRYKDIIVAVLKTILNLLALQF